MKEDVLEQIVEDYLHIGGYFTQHNIRFSPSKNHPEYDSQKDSVPSDVDVVGIHPKKRGRERVLVVSCKSGQSGFNASKKLADLRTDRPRSRPTWHHFRELWIPKWSEALHDVVEERTGAKIFDYRIAVTHLRGEPSAWADEPRIVENLQGSSFGFLTLECMWAEILAKPEKMPASSEIGRLAQLLKAAKLVNLKT